MLHLRPRNRFEDIDGMYLVGGGTHPGSGLPVIYEGARITSNLLCEDFGVRIPWAASEGGPMSDFGSDLPEIPRAAKVVTA
jgi:phytoene desaturase